MLLCWNNRCCLLGGLVFEQAQSCRFKLWNSIYKNHRNTTNLWMKAIILGKQTIQKPSEQSKCNWMICSHHLQLCQIFHCLQMCFIMFLHAAFWRENLWKTYFRATILWNFLSSAQNVLAFRMDNHTPPTLLNYVSSVVSLWNSWHFALDLKKKKKKS